MCLDGYWWFGGASSTVAGVVSVCVVRVVSVCVAGFGNCLVAVWWFDGSVSDCNACLGLLVGWWWVSDFGGFFLFGFGQLRDAANGWFGYFVSVLGGFGDYCGRLWLWGWWDWLVGFGIVFSCLF